MRRRSHRYTFSKLVSESGLPSSNALDKLKIQMNISKGTVFGEVEYVQNEDGSWSFRLTLDDDRLAIESDWTLPSKELAEEQVNYTLDSAALRIAEG
jgi:hypothetical protein